MTQLRLAIRKVTLLFAILPWLRNKATGEAIPHFRVEVRQQENACLNCPIVYEENSGLAWGRGKNGTYLFRGDARTYNEISLLLTINKCAFGQYSLRVINVTIGFNDGSYACWKLGSLIASFEISVQVTPTVVIVGGGDVAGQDTTRNVTVKEGSEVAIHCLIFSAIQPINVTWSRNGNSFKTEQFNGARNEIDNFTSNLNFEMKEEIEKFTCRVVGPYVKTQESIVLVCTSTSKLHGTEKTAVSDNGGTDVPYFAAPYVAVPVLLLSTLASVLMYFKVQKIRSQQMGSTEPAYSSKNLQVIKMPVGEEEQYESHYEMTDDVYFNGDNSVLRSDFVLVSSIPCYGGKKRWLASMNGEDKSLVVATTLWDSAKMDDWFDMRSLAEHLRHISKHENVAEISACYTNQIPYYIYTEHVTNGTLRDVLCKAKYDDTLSKTIHMQGLVGSADSSKVQRIGSFLLEPLKAIFFLESIDCDHFALCARKVLLTPNMVCKLYDFNLRSATKKVLANMNFEESLRLPWCAPETIFEKKYDRESDVWSFAVFIWEVFSEGDIPFDGVDIMTFASQPGNFHLLEKPRLCSDSVYTIMKSCFKVKPADRIALTALKTQLMNLVEIISK